MLTHGIPTAFRYGVHLFIPSTAIGLVPTRVYQVTRLRTDDVRCRESAGVKPEVLKAVLNSYNFASLDYLKY